MHLRKHLHHSLNALRVLQRLTLNPSHYTLCIQTPSPPLPGMDFDDLGIPDVRVKAMRNV